MHPDLVRLLEADDEAKRLVAEADRQLQARLEAARADREAERHRRLDERQHRTDALIGAIESAARQQAADERAARERGRQARAAAAEAVRAAAADTWAAIVAGREPPIEGGR